MCFKLELEKDDKGGIFNLLCILCSLTVKTYETYNILPPAIYFTIRIYVVLLYCLVFIDKLHEAQS